MRTVIYTRDFEPITVIDLPMWAVEQMHVHRTLWVEIMAPLKWASGYDNVLTSENIAVCLEVKRIQWIDRTPRDVIVAEDETTALKLKASWLPGQQGAINAYEEMSRALADALMRVLRHG